jgi:predicted metalloprotease with PDZ domain
MSASQGKDNKCCWGWGFIHKALGTQQASLVETGTPIIIVEAEKPSRDCSIGISLTRLSDNSTIVVHSIAADGLLASTKLQVGHKIVSVNGVPCPAILKDVITLLKEAHKGKLRIEACEHEEE